MISKLLKRTLSMLLVLAVMMSLGLSFSLTVSASGLNQVYYDSKAWENYEPISYGGAGNKTDEIV